MPSGCRLRIDELGRLEIVDPDLDALPLLQALDPAFRIRTAPLPEFTMPRLLKCRRIPSGISRASMNEMTDETLWGAHSALMSQYRQPGDTNSIQDSTTASLLDLKIELAHRLLRRCTLCARRCGVDRTRGEYGTCGLGPGSTVASASLHIAEEEPINPSLLVSLAGCGLRCRYCQQGTLLNPDAVAGMPLGPDVWLFLDWSHARSLSFIGGNPDESLPSILGFLNGCPENFALPIVWNTHAFSTPETLQLLEGVVDAYVPDFKYGNSECGRKWSSIPGYTEIAGHTIQSMLSQSVPVIVRILVLPGHVECCHKPALERLSVLANDQLHVSVRGQYAPDWKITVLDGVMARRVSTCEIDAVENYARSLQIPILPSE